jgi:hypothetical protein
MQRYIQNKRMTDKPTVKMLSPWTREIPVAELPIFSGHAYLLRPFDPRTIGFLDAFSKRIFAEKSISSLPEIAALAFWLRKTNLNLLREENRHLFNRDDRRTSPIGKVFHICPANVDTMFIYSLAVSLLMGNRNVLRVSSRMEAPHVAMLFSMLNELMGKEDLTLFSSYINIITYGHDAEVSGFISASVNARVIWGGDKTIGIFKDIRTAPRTKDIVFADRVSMFCLDSRSLLELDEVSLQKFMRKFFNDAYTFDQMGCSSPQTIYFLGDAQTAEECVLKFRKEASAFLKSNYKADIASIASLKLNRMADDAMADLITGQVGDNYLRFLRLEEGVDEAALHGCGGGYFYYRHVESVTMLGKLRKPKVQTICFFGLPEPELEALYELSNGEGIDRIVPLGQALIFNYIWDGYNLFDELSRKIYLGR